MSQWREYFSQFAVTQENNLSAKEFSQRTDALASRIGVSLSSLPDILGISSRMLWGYRSGKYPVTPKMLAKLAATESRCENGIPHPPKYEVPSRRIELRFAPGRGEQDVEKSPDIDALYSLGDGDICTAIGSVLGELGTARSPVVRYALTEALYRLATELRVRELRQIAAGMPES